MCEGRSSVVVILVTAALADGSQLVRVTVANPQSKQKAQMLIAKIGGLINRRVYRLPLSLALSRPPHAEQAGTATKDRGEGEVVGGGPDGGFNSGTSSVS